MSCCGGAIKRAGRSPFKQPKRAKQEQRKDTVDVVTGPIVAPVILNKKSEKSNVLEDKEKESS